MKKNNDYYDISPEISEHTAVWPGDLAFKRSISVDFKTGGNLLLSSIQTTLHIGAHADAPSHYHEQGQNIDQRDLHFYFGPCQVMSFSSPPQGRILPADLKGKEIVAERVLFRTDSFPSADSWNSDFCSLSEELIRFLAEKKVILVGIDTPSMDLCHDKVLEAHRAIYEYDMAVLEGIVLKDVPDGVYNLVALPLKIRGADASPVRAILIKT